MVVAVAAGGVGGRREIAAGVRCVEATVEVITGVQASFLTVALPGAVVPVDRCLSPRWP